MDFDIRTDKDDQIKTDEYIDKYLYEHSLSRTFGNMLTREDVGDGETELYQVGRLTGVDVSPIFRMANYINEELEFVLDGRETPEERNRILYSESLPKGSLKENIDDVLQMLNVLIERTSSIPKLPQMLDAHGYDALDNQSYFADFNIDKGDGYIGNNFGHDLRNFRKAVAFAKERGATTVYFGFD